MASRLTTEVQVSPRRYRFASYELDARTGELHKLGMRLRLQEQPLQVLLALLENPGEMVSREQLIARLWPAGTFVDFDLGLNAAVRRLRDLLNDTAENPRYIETLPRLGYRFIAAVEVVAEPEAAALLSPQGVPDEKQATPAVSWRWGPRVAIAAGLLLLALAIGLGAWRWTQPHAGVEFSQRDWVLISQFENRTGKPVLDGTLEYALERELSNSRFVKVVPRQRIQDALRLLRKPVDAKLDAALGREVCLRDGDIQALLTGRVEKLGSTYVLSVQVVDPARGVTLASFSEEDRADTELASAVRRLSSRVREALGEEPRQVKESVARLEKVTTPSLAALQLYSRANDWMVRSNGQWSEKEFTAMQGQAAALLQQALAVEPDFASAHLLLAWSLDNVGRRKEAAPHFRRAFELVGTVSDRERLFIQGSYHHASGDGERARQAYEALLALYPDDFWTVNNLVSIYVKQQRISPISELVARRADLRPRDFRSNFSAWNWLVDHKRGERARVYHARALALVNPGLEHEQPAAIVELEAAPFYDAWVRADFKTAANEAQKLRNKADLRTGDLGQATIFQLCEELWLLGRLHEADQWVDSISDPGERAFAKVGLTEARQDVRALRAALLEQLRLKAEVGPNTVARLARAGLVREAQGAMRIYAHPYPADADFAGGEIALAQGRLPEAVTKLSAAVGAYREHESKYELLAAMALARALERQGKAEEAIRVLAPEVESADVPYTMSDARLRLAQLYRMQGRPKEAERLEQMVQQALAYADPDHPMRALLAGASKASQSQVRAATVAPPTH